MKNFFLMMFVAALAFTACKKNPTPEACIDRSKIDPGKACPEYFKPVCGCDNVTYDNECFAQAAGVRKWTDGPCKGGEKPKPKPCIDSAKIQKGAVCETFRYEPVCGCDGKTYNSACEAEINGVTSWREGECDNLTQVCIDSSKINPEAICTREYNPVCGCNGKTYGNACEARAAGVMQWKQGECK